MTPSQFKSAVKKAERDAEKAVDDYNRGVRKHNSQVKRAVNEYNREARNYNSRVRSNQRRLESEVARLRRQPSTTRYVATTTSTLQLHEAFTHVDEAAGSEDWGTHRAVLAELAEAETANSAHMANTLLGNVEATDAPGQVTSTLGDELSSISPDLDQRWQGAVYAVSPNNPDAARHFCTSSREVLVQMLDMNAADDDVLAVMPACPKMKNGKPTRRAKISYLLERAGSGAHLLETFIDRDIDDVMELFTVFNSATHGAAGKFNLHQLAVLKERVEGAVRFLSTVIRG